MKKTNKTRFTPKKSKKIVAKKKKSALSLLKKNYWMAICVVAVVVAGGGLYNLRTNSLAVSLPSPSPDALYKQATQPVEVRVQDLLKRMSLEEKIGQMALVDKNSLKKIEDIDKYNLGGILSGAGAKPKTNTAQEWQDLVNGMKEQATKSRLAIPIFYGVDANHGHAGVPGSTVFPHAIGFGASADVDLVQSVAIATAKELSATGINWNFAPSLDAPKDIRWGRVYEAFSDDPKLNASLGAAYIRGTQTPQKTDGTESYVLATAKHYLATGSMQWGQSNHKKFQIDQGKVIADNSALKNEYLPPFRTASQAGVSSVMVALTDWDNQRIIDNEFLLTTKLKEEIGFKGFVVSDWYGVYEYANTSDYKANIKTINAGLDMAMLPYDYKKFIKDVSVAVRHGEISQARIDDAVTRILTQKFKAGLFEIDFKNADLSIIGSQSHRELARKAVASSSVLLKNSDQLLPLPKQGNHILITGSGADNVGRQSGAWTVEWQGIDGNWLPGSTSILQGIRQVNGNNTIDYSKDGNFSISDNRADIGIAVVSEKPYAEGFGDNANPTLDEADKIAIERLKLKSNKVILIIVSGRPLIINEQIATADAVIAAWLPGSEGAGIADVLFGNQIFKAKLPLPWPLSVQQLPISTDGKSKDNTEVLFKRGFGL